MAKASSTVSFNPKSVITCGSCGSVYTIGSVFDTFKLDICGNCHPVYTGKSILVDTAGQLKKFQDRQARAVDTTSTPKQSKVRVRRSIQTLEDIEKEVA
jgi:large subunit ribosomal protein L31